MLQVIRAVFTKGEGGRAPLPVRTGGIRPEKGAWDPDGRVCVAAFISGMGIHPCQPPCRPLTTSWAAFAPEAGRTPLWTASCRRAVSNTMPHPRLKLNTIKPNRDEVVTEQGSVFTYTGGVFSLYQL